jgi:hypothetical protein
MNAEIIHYAINLDKLIKIKNDKADKDKAEEGRFHREGMKNKKRLLKFVLPYVHSVFELHNHKCLKTSTAIGGRVGLLGHNKINVQEKIDYIVNTDSRHVWSNNFQTFTFINNEINMKQVVKIWLNSREGAFKATPHLEYSLLSVDANLVYGESIEKELEKIAELCAVFTEDW